LVNGFWALLRTRWPFLPFANSDGQVVDITEIATMVTLRESMIVPVVGPNAKP
jgi:hypothetical protein